jgi:hypothetical protein
MSNSEGEINLKHIGKDGPQPCYLCSNFLTMIRILALLIVVAIMACNNAADNNTPKAKTQADSLMDKVMEGHNVAMAKMAKLHGSEKKIQSALDSISNLPGNRQKDVAGYKLQLDSILKRLKYAEFAMDKWMTEFNMDSAKDDEKKRVEYLESEKIKISKVKDAIISTLQASDSLWKQAK